MNAIKTFVVTLVLVVVILAISCALSGCGNTNQTESKVAEKEPSMFIVVESSGIWYVVYHRETKVMYAVSRDDHNKGIFTLLVNPDGTPMLYEGENDG